MDTIILTSELARNSGAFLDLTIGSFLAQLAVATVGLAHIPLFSEAFTSLVQAVFTDFTLTGFLADPVVAALNPPADAFRGLFMQFFQSPHSPTSFLIAQTYGNVHLNVAFEQVFAMMRDSLPL